jgi:hypothetical protein
MENKKKSFPDIFCVELKQKGSTAYLDSFDYTKKSIYGVFSGTRHNIISGINEKELYEKCGFTIIAFGGGYPPTPFVVYHRDGGVIRIDQPRNMGCDTDIVFVLGQKKSLLSARKSLENLADSLGIKLEETRPMTKNIEV